MPTKHNNSPLKKFLEDGEQRFADLEKLMQRHAKRLDTVESKTKNRSVSLGSSTKDEQEFSVRKLIHAIATNDWTNAGFEREVTTQAKRDMSYGTASAGGYVVPELYLGQQFIDTLNAQSVVLASGVTQLNGLSTTPVLIPKKTGNVTTYYKAENAAITESQLTLNEISFSPKHLTAMTVMSNESLSFSNPSLEALVRNDIATQLALRVDLECLEGDGLSNNPAGVLTFAGAATVDIGAVTVEKLYNMLYELELADAEMSKVGWVMHPRTWNQIRQLRAGGSTTTDGPFLVQPDPTNAANLSLLGFPVRLSTQVSIDLNTAGTESTIFLANWADAIHASWGSLEIMASREASDFFHNNQTGVRAVMHHDFAARHEASFVTGDGVDA